jgi:hypothetical protein
MAYRLIYILSFFSVVALSSLIYFFYTLLKSHRKWKEAVRDYPQNRMLKSKQDFIDFYLKLGYKEEDIDFVYFQTQKFLKAKDLVLLPTDDIVNLYERGRDEWLVVLNRWLVERGDSKIIESNFKAKYFDSINFELLIKAIQSKGMI